MIEEPDQSRLSSQDPPSLPPAVLSYARPMSSRAASARAASFGQRAAKFSWTLPLIALGIGSCANVYQAERPREPVTAIVMGVINLSILVAGMTMGIIALVGVRRCGRERVLVPAIIGVSINGLLMVAMVILLLSGR